MVFSHDRLVVYQHAIEFVTWSHTLLNAVDAVGSVRTQTTTTTERMTTKTTTTIRDNGVATHCTQTPAQVLFVKVFTAYLNGIPC